MARPTLGLVSGLVGAIVGVALWTSFIGHQVKPADAETLTVTPTYTDAMAVSAAMAAGMMTGLSGACTAAGPGVSVTSCTMTLPNPVAVSALPACNGSIQGQVRLVNNALLPALLGILTGGGGAIAPTFCNGTNWVVF